MNQQARRIEWLVWGSLLLVIACIVLAFLLAQFKMRAFLGKPLAVIGQVEPFSLTNQMGQAISLTNLMGHVWVADIIFTRCSGPCPKMTRQMKELEQALPAASETKLVTLTTDPRFDTPAVLNTYAERFSADTNRWMFLTGPNAEIAKLAVDSLKLIAVEKKPEQQETPQDLFVHSTIFVIVDKMGRLRGAFETTGEDVDPRKAKEQIIAAARRLEREK
jgi:protein SCO1/2